LTARKIELERQRTAERDGLAAMTGRLAEERKVRPTWQFFKKILYKSLKYRYT
jgi:hypothetical protein